MTFGSSLLYTGLLAPLLMAVVWLIQRRTGDAGIVDVVWSGALGIAALVAALDGPGDITRRLIVGAIAGLWSQCCSLQTLLLQVWHSHQPQHL